MSSFKFFKQPDQMDCGPTCLRMVAKCHGRNHSIQRLRELTEIGKDGVNMLGIAEAGQTRNVKFLLLFAAQKQTEKMNLLSRNELKAIKGGFEEGGTCCARMEDSSGVLTRTCGLSMNEARGLATQYGEFREAGYGDDIRGIWCCASC